MKKILSLSLIMLIGIVSVSAKTSIDLADTKLTNVTAQENADGSVTFSLTDPSIKGTIRFNSGSGDISSYQSVYYSYSQNEAGKVTYILNNQYVNTARKSSTPSSTLQGISSFNIQELTASQLTSSYFAITIAENSTGAVTIYEAFFTDKFTKQDETLLSQLTYSSGTPSVNAGIKINGTSSYQIIAGPNSPNTGTYYDLSAYDNLSFTLSYPAENEGEGVVIRLQFVNETGDALQAVYSNPNPVTGSGTYTFDLSTMPSKKLAGIKAWAASAGTAFTLTVIDVSVYNGTTVGISENEIDEADKIVDVYHISGVLVRKSVKNSEATIGLDKGIYIVGNKKVAVK